MKSNGVPPAAGERKRGAAVPPDPEVSAKAKRRRFTAGVQAVDHRAGRPVRDTGRDRSSAAARGAVQLASVGVAEGGAGRVAAGAGQEARPEAFGREAGCEEPAKARA